MPTNALTGALGEVAQEQHATSAYAFSRLAPHYDVGQGANRIARWSRARNLRILGRAFTSDDLVLEMGCGTGEEAMHLARRGVRVVATDAAPAMVGVLESKLSYDKALTGLITPLVMPASEVGALTDRFGPGSFDGAFSSFGPLNCEPDLAPVVEGLARLVRPGGLVVISLIGRFCLWETFWHLARLEPDKAFRRWRGHTWATVSSEWQEERIEVFHWMLLSHN